MKTLAMLLAASVLAAAQQPESRSVQAGSALKLELKLEAVQYEAGAPITAPVRLTNSSDRKVSVSLELDRIKPFDGTLAGAVRLMVRDEEGKHRGIGEFGNFNRGSRKAQFAIPAAGTLEGTVGSFLGYWLAKGNERKDLPAGKYMLYAVLGDQPAAWSPGAAPRNAVRSNSVPMRVVEKSRKLRVSDLAWLSGKWTGKQGTTTFEETWSVPAAGSMLGTFRWMVNDKSSFFEFLLLEEDAEGVVLRFKHFSPGFRPWEKEGPNELRASQPVEGRLVFTNTRKGGSPARMIYERSKDDSLKVTIESMGRSGKPETLGLDFRRSR
jgi:hypothetical protein